MTELGGRPAPAPLAAAPPLARATLDRAGHRRRDAAWLADAWQGAHILVVDARGRALVRGSSLILLDAATAPAVPETDRLFLGVEPDGTPVFTVAAELPAIEGAEAVNLRDIGHLLDDRDAGLFTAAAALINWHPSRAAGPASTTTARSCGRVPIRR
jgi:NAD+ diphosphatase